MSLQSSEIAHLKAKEAQLIKEVHQLRDMKRKFEEDMFKVKNAHMIQLKEAQEQFEAEQYFTQLYKKQSTELREEMEEKLRIITELEDERVSAHDSQVTNHYNMLITVLLSPAQKLEQSLMHQLQIALARADSEALARTIAEETVADLEKEKTMKELELKDLVAKHRNEMATMKDVEYDINMELSKRRGEVDDLKAANRKLQDDLAQAKSDQSEIERLQQKLKTETLLKQTAVNKLAEIMNRKDLMLVNDKSAKKKMQGSAADVKKKEKEIRRLQQEMTQERDKFNQLHWRFNEMQSALTEEVNQRTKLQMEMDSKDVQIEMMQSRLVETKSLSSAENDAPEEALNATTNTTSTTAPETFIEGWLSVPNKQNIRRHGWRKQYVVVSTKKIIFYNSEQEKKNSDPVLTLDLAKVFHVRSVTQGDVIRAASQDITRIFQLLYAGEGEARRPDEQQQLQEASHEGERNATTVYKGHEFVAISFHMPTTCEVCPKQMWQVFRPPPAYECRRCHVKLHKEHVENNDPLTPCKLHHDPQAARELLLLASNEDDQAKWISRLSKRIQKSGYKANSSSNNNHSNQSFNNSDGSKVSPR